MRASQLFFPTLREVPGEAELISHQLLLRAGFIRRLAAGVYSYLPLARRVLHRIEDVVREEMNRSGAQELTLPTLQPEELWMRTMRTETWGPELIRLKDRTDRTFCLGATHEEVITDLVAGEVKSYRELPINLYQIATKSRDEPRPRGGVIRAREFVMKDAYSFDVDEAGLERSYETMRQAYCRIFDRFGLPYVVAQAEAAAMGGSGAEDFMLPTESGEGVFFACSGCDYSAEQETATFAPLDSADAGEALLPIENVATPGRKTVEQVTSFLGVGAERLIKTLIYVADERPVAALVRGDRDLNETALRKTLGARSLEMAGPDTIEKVTGAPVGFAGPVGIADIPVIADNELRGGANYVTGANENDAHLRNVNIGRDFGVGQWGNLRFVVAGDRCSHCGGVMEATRGIELAGIFKLGTYYSDALGARFVDEEGHERAIWMGSYGIGVTRVMAAAIEYSHDRDGIVWPPAIAPFDVHVMIVNSADATQRGLAEQAYDALVERGAQVLLDDRNLPAGVKFKDMDLIGIPVQIIAGKTAAEGKVEFRLRKSRATAVVDHQQAVDWAVACLDAWRVGEEPDLPLEPRG
ncbi:prolyl-tRNA synthetase [candidate division KD3-62 bacterium DG_56]|uniref:Proline--tRNA ligase n=1 Tax=candidate division KD3-62 bacterium DG_56 TaxID=1704032 RepID=A0A0S7XR17_9BACT|nr:MAG: prolyl-tRNA synthetase [candidate division KD3-62 bacterium DG_56]